MAIFHTSIKTFSGRLPGGGPLLGPIYRTAARLPPQQWCRQKFLPRPRELGSDDQDMKLSS